MHGVLPQMTLQYFFVMLPFRSLLSTPADDVRRLPLNTGLRYFRMISKW